MSSLIWVCPEVAKKIPKEFIDYIEGSEIVISGTIERFPDNIKSAWNGRMELVPDDVSDLTIVTPAANPPLGALSAP